MRIGAKRSEEFEMKVGVYQSSVLSPLPFAIVIDEITKNVREDDVRQLLYADHLVLLGDSWEEADMVLPGSSKVGLDNNCLMLNVYDVFPRVRRINRSNKLTNYAYKLREKCLMLWC